MRSAQVAIAAVAPMLALAQSSDDSIYTVTAGGATYTADYDDPAYTIPAWSEVEDTIPVSEFLSQYYGASVPTAATGAAATSLASAIYVYQEGLQTDSAYIEAANTIYLAIATRSDGDAIISSIDGQGFLNGDYTTADWYKTGVPTSAQSEFATVIASFKAVETSVLGETGAAATTATAKATATGSTTVTSAASGSGTASGASASSTSASTAGAPRSMATGGAVAGLAAAIAVGVMY